MIGLVTGASAGIGRRFAIELGRGGYDVVLVARSSDALCDVASEIEQKFGVSTTVIPIDLSTETAAFELAERLRTDGVAIDCLINNAGFGSVGHFRDLPLERELAMIRLNISALVAMTGHVLPQMVARGHGTIVNVSSVVATHPSPGFAVYAATKAFVTSFSAALTVELEGTGVHVQALHPGSTATNFQAVAGSGGRTPGGQQTAAQVVACSMKALEAGKPIVVSGWMNRLLFPLMSAIPVGISARMSGRVLNRAARAKPLENVAKKSGDLAKT